MLSFGLLVISFIAFWLSLIGWGRLLSKGSDLSLNLLMGSALFMVLPSILSVFSKLNDPWLPVAFVGLGLSLSQPWHLLRMPWMKRPRLEKIAILTIGVLLFCRVFEASLIQPHGDALYYHLLSAAKWRHLGEIKLIPELPLLLQASWWDYIYLWPAMFFLREPHQGLVEVQIFSQWTHLLVAFWGSLLLLNRILEKFEATDYIRWFSSLALASCGSLWWSAALAKNDWGGIFLTLGGLLLLLENRMLLAGLILGLAVSAKWTLGFSVVSILLWQLFRNWRSLPLVSAGLILGIAPIALRNFHFTGNPIFPIPFLELGQEHLSLSFMEYIRQYTSIQENWLATLINRLGILKESLFISLGAASAIFLIYKSKRQNELSSLFLCLALGFGLFIFGSGSHAENRLYGPGIVLLAGIGCALTFAALPRLHWGLLVLVLVFSRIPTHMPAKFFAQWPPSQQITNTNAGAFKLKIQKEVSIDEGLATNGDNENFYLSYFRITDLTNHPSLDHAFRNTSDLKVFFKEVHAQGYRYLLHTARYDGHCYGELCQKIQEKFPELEPLIVFRDGPHALLDLSR